MKCKAVLSGKAKRKGRASVEWYKSGKPQYYCCGYIDQKTDDIIPECQQCRKHVNHAQEDFDDYMGCN